MTYTISFQIELRKTSVLPHGFFPEFINVIKYEKLLEEMGAGRDPASLSDDSCAKKHALRKVQAKRKANAIGNADNDYE